MRIQIVPFFFPGIPVPSTRYDAAFLFDLYRATSTMVVLSEKGAAQIFATDSLEVARETKRRDPTCFLCGERNGKPPEGFDAGNSPVEMFSLALQPRKVVMTTSNGTRCLLAFQGSSPVFLAASLLNVEACRQKILQAGWQTLLFLCAGTGGEFSLEDFAGCSLLAHSLRDALQPPFSDTLSASLLLGESLWRGENWKQTLQHTDHARRLQRDGMQTDVAFILDHFNAFSSVPTIRTLENPNHWVPG